MSNATAGPGFLLQVGDGGAPETFTTISEVKDINGPGLSMDVHDVTNQSSPGGYEEIIPGIRRSGEITFSVNAIPSDATHNGTTGMLANLNAKAKKNWRVTNNDSGVTHWAGAGYFIKIDQKAPVNGVLTWDCTFKITGQPTLGT